MIAGRTTLMSHVPEPLPYDSEIEYIESTGTQIINTGLNSVAWTTLDIDMAATGNYQSNGNFFGSYYDSNSGMFATVEYSTISGGRTVFNVRANERNSAIGWQFSISDVDKWYLRHSLHIDWNNPSVGASSVTGTLDGANRKSATTTGQFTDNTTKLRLFGRAQGGDGIDYEKTRCRIYCAKIWQNGVLVRDYAPVRIGLEGCMYDRVTKTVFHNGGTGSFIKGRDVPPPYRR